MVAAADALSPDGQSALATLCETYWVPVYAFIRRTGRSSDDAKDLTQAFFARLLEKNFMADARRERGRFRSFLLGSVRHFLANEYDRGQALKRGGRLLHVPIEFEVGERQYQHEPVEHETPERLYERRWAIAVLDLGKVCVKAKYAGPRRETLFERLEPFLTGDDPPSYAELAAEVQMTEGSLRVAVHRLREHFRHCLRDAIAETVESSEEVDEELGYLMTIVGR